MERKRQQAPGDLERVREFVNTFDLEPGTDELASPAELVAWMRERGLAPSRLRATERDLARAIELREALRRILLSHNRGEPPAAGACQVVDKAARRARLRVRFDGGGGATLEPEAGGMDGALGRLLAIVHGAITQGTWERLKACRERSCEWAFYDHTKNRLGAWCTMQVCGNRAKARAYRSRRAGSPA